MKTTSSTPSTPESIVNQLRAAAGATAVLAILCCGIYPAAVWGVAQALFPFPANGSLIQRDGAPAASDAQAIGSMLIGQNFSADRYFHPRPSAAGAGYDGGASSGTNLGPLSRKLVEGLADDSTTGDADESYAGIPQWIASYRRENNLDDRAPVPADAVTRSASGLDPHISPANADLQAARVASARGMALSRVKELINANTAPRTLGVLGEAGVNVLRLNIALDQTQAAGG